MLQSNRVCVHRLAATCAAVTVASSIRAQTILHVDDTAPAGGNGASWQTAFRDLQDALTRARQLQGTVQVLIGQGTYRADRGTGNRGASFEVGTQSSVTLWLMGGFAGLGAVAPDERDPSRFLSVLSGDLLGNDGPGFANRADNSHHVVTAGLPFSENALLSGLTIRGGQADGPGDGRGGGVRVVGTNPNFRGPEIEDCRIVDSFAAEAGGGVHYELCELLMHGCAVSGNSATNGGGIQVEGGHNVEIFDTAITGNTAGLGGGIALDLEFSALIERCTIAGNHAHGGGGVWARCRLEIGSSRITGNSALLGGGGVLFAGSNLSQPLEMRNCTVTSNWAQSGGGIEFASGESGDVLSSILWNNSASSQGPGVHVIDCDNRVNVERCLVSGGQGSISGPPGLIAWRYTNLDIDPGFVDADGPDGNLATWQDNDEQLRFTSPCIDWGMAWHRIPPDGRLDLTGSSRLVNSLGACVVRSDLGAYEIQTVMPVTPIPVLYVNQNAAPGGDGRSWATAYNDLQSALYTPGAQQVWIAGGHYTPGPSWDDRLSFEVGGRISLYGGFGGFETSLEQRIPGANTTVLSGQQAQRVMLAEDADILLDSLEVSSGFVNHLNFGFDGGAGLRAEGSIVKASDCRWLQNLSVSGAGGAIGAADCEVLLADCRFEDNQAGTALFHTGGSACAVARGPLTIVDSTFFSNTSPFGNVGAVSAYGSGDKTIERCVFEDNDASVAGAMSLAQGRIVIRDTLFLKNQARLGFVSAGGAVRVEAPQCEITGCTFLGNVAKASTSSSNSTSYGGALASYGELTLTGCWFSGNQTGDARKTSAGGAVAVLGNATITNCTIVNNKAAGPSTAAVLGGGVYLLQTQVGQHQLLMRNTLLWGNESFTNIMERRQLDGQAADIDVGWSCIQGWSGAFGGPGNLGTDPALVNPRGPDNIAGTIDDNPRIGPSSSCIDAAASPAVPSGLMLDVLGNPRFSNDLRVPDTGVGPAPVVDIGAVEFVGSGCYVDCNRDDAISLADFGCFATKFALGDAYADCNADGVRNLSDFGCFQTKFALGCP